jgi:rRNA processing protein Krr1/Pno1
MLEKEDEITIRKSETEQTIQTEPIARDLVRAMSIGFKESADSYLP